MYKILLENFQNTHEYEELIKIFLKNDEYEIITKGKGDFSFEINSDKNITKKEIFNKLQEVTGKTPSWGIVTGIRPVKMTGELLQRLHSKKAVKNKLIEYYCTKEEKADLALSMYEYQKESLGDPEKNSAGIYIGIPFCPSICSYCSFGSKEAEEKEIEKYLLALYNEIDFVKTLLKENNIYAESIYIGGGTPTTLKEKQLEELIINIKKAFGSDRLREFTIEAGRADTITEGKIKIFKENNVDRISINPQTMKEKTLEIIGRAHSKEQVISAFEMAEGLTVNADIIAGLPGETIEDFTNTVKELIEINPANITVHSLAIKRASKLIDIDREFHYKQGELVGQMLLVSKALLEKAGYRPYYLYRQKHMSGAEENIGYCKTGKEGLYNVRIMDEHQSIIAMGAGGISKVYYPEENRLERIPNVSNYEIYIERIEEMKDRKKIIGGNNVNKCT